MKQTLLMERLLGETRLAVIEDDKLCEMYIDRGSGDAVAGDIVLGKVQNIVPGLNAAFIDIGLDKNGFLSAGDVAIGDRELQKQLSDLNISKLVRPGQDVPVQVIKAQSGQKGHRVSCHITLPGRNLVLLPNVRYTGVSRKIADDAERARLRSVASSLQGPHGVIVRTAAEGADEDAIAREYEALTALWEEIEVRAKYAAAPTMLYSNEDLALRCARDMLTDDIEAVLVDDRDACDALRKQVALYAPERADIVKSHTSDTPLFDLYRVDRQLDKALHKFVWLKSGGSLVIEATEAMTVIDVNTGKFTGNRAVEETIYKLNCEAAEEIVRQLRLRDVGGIIIVDFIDMKSSEHNEALVEYLKELASRDRNRLIVVGMTGLGLVELTRRRERQSLQHKLLHTCSHCGGDGRVPTHEECARRILREVRRMRRGGSTGALLVEAPPPVAGMMQKIGAPEGGRTYARANDTYEPDAYTIVPADESRLPEGTRLLK